ncbi:MAG TPA: zf-HC2 domain-containing protein [Longimicrobiales bacterium]|nr:zf-HC2 domain-containing protein [Longimicrobiales bacterium]
MTTMRCEAVRDALPALARGTASEAEAAALRDHIAGCAACAAEAGIVDALVQARIAERDGAPAGLAERVSSELERRSRLAEARAPRALPRAIRWTAAAGLAAAAMIALIVAVPEGARQDAAADGDVIASATAAPAEADPFLNDELFGADAGPLDAELDDVLEGVDVEAIAFTGGNGALPPLAMDIGSPPGDWPGADGTSAGGVLLDELTYDEMRLLLTEMET